MSTLVLHPCYWLCMGGVERSAFYVPKFDENLMWSYQIQQPVVQDLGCLDYFVEGC